MAIKKKLNLLQKYLESLHKDKQFLKELKKIYNKNLIKEMEDFNNGEYIWKKK